MKLITIISLLCTILSCSPKQVAQMELYPMESTVISVDGDRAIVETPAGFTYAYYADDAVVGDKMALILCDVGTKEVIDDIVVTAHYHN